MNIYSAPIKPATLYVDKVQNKTVLYNLVAGRGILVAGAGIAGVLELCNGVRNISSIAKAVSLSSKETLQIVKKLADYGVLNISAYQPPPLPRTEPMLRIWVHTTNACNLDCSYCFVKKDGRKMSIGIAHKLVDALHRSLTKHKDVNFYLNYTLAGGEPLTNLSVVKEVLDYSYVQAQQFGIKRVGGIVSNGTILNSEIVALVKHHNTGFSISVDGFGEMNRNRVFKNGRSAINIILRNIDKLLRFGIRPFILITITPENIDGLVAFTKYLLQRELSFSYSLVRDKKTAINLNGYRDKLITVLNECYDLMEKMLPKSSRYTTHKFGTVSLSYRRYRGCSLGTRSFIISHDGKVYLCQMDIGRRPAIATVEDNDILGKLWTQTDYPELHKYKNIDNYDGCSLCCWRYQCAGGCPLLTKMATGHLNKPSPYCLVYQKMIPRLIRIDALKFIIEQTRIAHPSKEAPNL